jgi:hypothetical protein
LRAVRFVLVTIPLVVSCAERFEGWEELSRPSEAQVRDLLAADGVLYLATLGEGVYASSDEGVTWEQLPGTEGMEAHRLARGDGGLFIGAAEGVYLYDGGEVTPAGLEGEPVWSLDVGGGVALAGAVGAVHARSGAGWEELPPGLPPVAVTSVLDVGGEVYAGTLGEGLWVLRESAGEGEAVRRWAPVAGSAEMPLDAAEVTLLRYDGGTGRLYVGTMWGGLYVSEGDGFFKLRGLDPEFKYVSGLIFVDERLFITTCGIRADGLYSASFDGRNWRLWYGSPHPARGVVRLSDGRLLVATEYEGLYAAYPPETDRVKPDEGDE